MRTTGVLAGALALGALIFNLFNDAEPRLPDEVEYEAVLESARSEYAYPVVAPESTPEGWRATSVDSSQQASGDRWRLGFLTDDEQYVGVQQSDGEIESFRADELAEFSSDGESTVNGGTWERFVENDNSPDHALTRVADGAVTIVTGTVSYDRLEDFVATLQ